MDNNNIFIMTSSLSCLHSFFPTVGTFHLQLQLSNFPTKLAQAGFERTPESKSATGISDEVRCKTCGVKYSGWSGERPLAVHRTLSPNCHFLNTPPSHNRNIQKENRTNALRNVRRQLFPSYDMLESKIEDYPEIQHPFVPKRGDFLMLFESFRLLTFQDPTSAEAAVFAKCGFVFDSNSQNAACVFCNQELDYRPMKLIELEFWHEQECTNCPFVKEYDVGNISCEEERQIKEKEQKEMSIKVSQDKKDFPDCLIKHPEYENIENRIGTFKQWPAALSALDFSDVTMAECGFYYTGFRDSVKCFSCGIVLCQWTKGTDPCSQHAKASPDCFFVQQLKGQEFVDVCQRVQLTVEVEYKEECHNDSYDSSDSESSTGSTTSSSSSIVSSSPSSQVGSPHLDFDAIKAATCQYTIQKIANAVSNFFVLSNGRYPNTDLLLGTLKAADQSYIQVCQQRQELIIKDRVIKAKESDIEQSKKKESFYERKLRATQTELARAKDTIEWRDVKLRTELEQKFMGQIREHKETLRQRDELIEQKDALIVQSREMMERKDMMLELKNKEVADLNRHVESLMAILKTDANALQSFKALVTETEAETSASEVEEFPVASCKVCLSSKAQVVFLPCKHLCCCDSCAARLYGKSCPICRETNLALEKVYVI